MKPMWTEQEIDFLRNNIDCMTLEQISAHLNRGIPAIKVKCWKCGISKATKVRVARLVVALGYEPEYDFVEISKILGISKSSTRDAYVSGMKKLEKIL